MALPIITNQALGFVSGWMYGAKNQPNWSSARLRWILLKSSGLEADTVLRDYDDLTALLASTNDECTFTGYSRLTVATTDISITVQDTPDNVKLDITTDPFWDPTSAEAIGAIVLGWNPDGADTSIIPVFIDTIGITTGTGGASSRVTYQISSSGWCTAQQG